MGLLNKTIFVFGSNRQGRHGKGCAKTALKKWGAKYGQAEGLQGQSYGIITKELRRSRKKVTLREIREGVERFLKFAKANPHYTFIVTPIGCGLAGRTPKQIGPVFRKSTSNVRLPREFRPYCRSLEDRFAVAWKKKFGNLPKPKRQYKFDSQRRWAFDFAWVRYRIAVEIQGGSFIFGGHNRGASQAKDFEKQNEATRQGWRVFFFNTYMMGQVGDGKIYDCVRLIAEVLTDAKEV